MMAFGLDPVHAVANTRFSVLGTDLASIVAFHRARRIRYRLALPLAILAFVTSMLVARELQHIPKETLKLIIGGAILLLVVLAVAFPRIGTEPGRERGGLGVWIFGSALIMAATALTTVSGGAAGAVYSYILVLVFGQTFLDSAGTRKIVALGLTLGAIPTFMLLGLVDYAIAVPLLAANAAGGWFGARYMIRRGEKVVRQVFLAGVLLIAAWLVYEGVKPASPDETSQSIVSCASGC
jgi:uncharacterized membrane protein YfcA